MSHLSGRRNKEAGQGLVEYALLLMLVGTVVIGALALVGRNTGNVFSNIACSLQQSGQCPAASNSNANSNQNTNTSANQNTSANSNTSTNTNTSSSGNCGNGNGNGNGAANGCGNGNSNSSGSGNCGNGNGNGNGASNGCGNRKPLPTQHGRDARSVKLDAKMGF